MSARVLAAATPVLKAMDSGGSAYQVAYAAIGAADAHDTASGVHRVSLDDETVERVTECVWPFDTAHYLQAFGETQDEAQARGLRERQVIVRAVLAAAVKEEQ